MPLPDELHRFHKYNPVWAILIQTNMPWNTNVPNKAQKVPLLGSIVSLKNSLGHSIMNGEITTLCNPWHDDILQEL